MKMLVAITNYGTKNDGYLARLLAEYRAMPYQVKVVVLSNVPKDFGPDVEVLVGPPVRDPWCFAFNHKRVFEERQNDFDLYVYSEDDTPLTSRNIGAFLEATRILPDSEIAGFLRFEQDAAGKRYFSTIHSHFHWDPGSAHCVAGEVFAHFTNHHSGSYVLTRHQLKKAIASGGFTVPAHSGQYDSLVSAATDPYTECGFHKVICISRLEDFVLPHLPNNYIGRMGLPEDMLNLQVKRLLNGDDGSRYAGIGLPLSSRLPQSLWSKSYYEAVSNELLDLVPPSASSILSLGSGSGELESAFVKRGQRVVAVPLDDVIGQCALAVGVELWREQFWRLGQSAGDRRFDCIVVPDLLHLAPDPVAFLGQLKPLVAANGCIVVSVPNTERVSPELRRIRRKAGLRYLGDYARTGVHRTGPKRLRRWLSKAGLRTSAVRASSSERLRVPRKLALGLADGLLARRLFAAAQIWRG